MKVIILAGGSGTRLWPLSRTNKPKQFIKLMAMNDTIFQMTVKRALNFCIYEDIYFVANNNYSKIIEDQLAEINFPVIKSNILIEPNSKNTLPAITYGIKTIQDSKGNDNIIIFPSDHLIHNIDHLKESIINCTQLTSKYLFTLGVNATKPETGYGYIKPGTNYGYYSEITEFKEKPDYETALKYMEKGYLWNSGIFFFNSKFFMEQIQIHAPNIYNAFQLNSIQDSYKATQSISIDYGLMEKTNNSAVIPFPGSWNDLGDFSALYSEYKENLDNNGNVLFNNEIIIDSHNNMVYSDNHNNKTIALIGINDLIIIDQPDALLICNKNNTQQVKDIVNLLKQKEINDIKREIL